MSVQLSPGHVADLVKVASVVGSIILMMILSLAVFIAVRPSRRDRQARDDRAAIEAEADEAWRQVDRMEARLAVLERAMAEQIERPRPRVAAQEEIFAPADEGRDSGRK